MRVGGRSRMQKVMTRTIVAGITGAAAAALGPAASFAGTTTITGIIKVEATVTLGPNVAPKVSISGSAGAAPDQIGQQHNESASVSLKRSGNRATGEIDLPYAWTVLNDTKSVLVSFTASSPFQQGTGINSSSAHVTVPIPLPKDGAVTHVKLAVTM